MAANLTKRLSSEKYKNQKRLNLGYFPTLNDVAK